MARAGGDAAAGAGPRLPPASQVTAAALRGLARFAESRGIPADLEFWLDYDVIEAFCRQRDGRVALIRPARQTLADGLRRRTATKRPMTEVPQKVT